MEKNVVKEIIDKIKDIEGIIPYPYDHYNFDSEANLEVLVGNLVDWFEKMEGAIVEKHKEPYVTDEFENQVKSFSLRLVSRLIEYHNILKKRDNYLELLKRRHIGYGFYTKLNSLQINEIKDKYMLFEKIRKEEPYNKILYSSLVEYFNNFYGQFYDNESAIKMLCCYYPDELALEGEIEDKLAQALYRHVTNAGSPGDVGFAFGGIKMIEQWFDRLPPNIIDKILEKYEIFRVLNDEVYRKQIFTIINHSCLKSKEKETYKFFFIDSILLANSLNRFIFEKYKEIEEGIESSYIMTRKTLKERQIPSFSKTEGSNSIQAYWTYESLNCRILKYKDETILRICYKGDSISISFSNRAEDLTIKFENGHENWYKNWLLDEYNTEEFHIKLEGYIKEIKIENIKIKASNEKFTFSHLYIDSYRSVLTQELSFDGKYSYKDKAININISNPLNTCGFYGKNIYSLSCIVGKNGTGKTSLVEFLKGSFFKLLYLTEYQGLKINNGFVDEKDYSKYKILDEGAKFLIIFNFYGEVYYLTNIKDIMPDEVKPYPQGLFGRNDFDLSKVIYFSNMLNINDMSLYTDINANRTNEKSLDLDFSKSINTFRNSDYSEKMSFTTKNAMFKERANNDRKTLTSTELTGTVNRDLCYQLAFLDAHSDQDLDRWFDRPLRKDISIYQDLDYSNGISIKDIGELKEVLGDETHQLSKLLYLPNARMNFFSSGQYTKFSFLAKLYWCLEGYSEYAYHFEKIVGSNVFDIKNTLQDNDTALLFIDEGELYYHPEWQRTYINTLVEFVKKHGGNIRIQIIITSNSPFIISDMMDKDVIYLPRDEDNSNSLTFGQNIHKLLKKNFFMKNTIGEFAMRRIGSIITWINELDELKQLEKMTPDELQKIGKNFDAEKHKTFKEITEGIEREFGIEIPHNELYNYLKSLIELIGEDVYREKLTRLLDNYFFSSEEFQLELLKQQKRALEEQIRELEEKAGDS